MTIKLSGKQKEQYERVLKLQKRATNTPNTLVKLSAGNYYFFSTLENELLIVSDDSYENGGGSEWVVRQAKDSNVVNDYPTLKSFKEDWVK